MTEYMLNNKFNDPFNKVKLGVSLGERNQLEEFSKVLRSGANMVEVDIASVYGLMEERGGSAANIGKEERQIIGNLAKVNDVDLSIHAPWAINFSGIDPNSGQRNPEYGTLVNNEIKAAVKFADDVSQSMGRKNMPIIFHASSDQFGDPDKSLRLTAYDNYEDKVLLVSEERLDHVDSENFKKMYGEENFKKLSQLGMKEDPERKSIVLPPAANFEFKKILAKGSYTQERSNLEFSKRNVELQLNEIPILLARAAAKNDLAEIENLKKKKADFDQMLKDLEARKMKLELDSKNIDSRYKVFDELAPQFAAEGIKTAAMESFNSATKPMILVENPMSPNMSLSNPKATAKTVQIAREEFANELVQKRHMSKAEAKQISEELIGINLDVGHVNVFKSYSKGINPSTGEPIPYTDEDIVNMAKDAKNYIKRFHLNDNMGDVDAHLPLGQGNAPVKKIYDELLKSGVDVPAIMEVFGGLGGMESGSIQSLQYMGAPAYGNVPYASMSSYLSQPYSAIIGDYSSYSNLGLRQDFFPYSGFSGIMPISGGGYMNNNNSNNSFSGASMY